MANKFVDIDFSLSWRNAAAPPEPIGQYTLPKKLCTAALKQIEPGVYRIETGGFTIPAGCFADGNQAMIHFPDKSKVIITLLRPEPIKGAKSPSPTAAVFESADIAEENIGKMVTVMIAEKFDLYRRNHWTSAREAIYNSLVAKKKQNASQLSPANAAYDHAIMVAGHASVWESAYEKVYSDDPLTFLENIKKNYGDTWQDTEEFTARYEGWKKLAGDLENSFAFIASERLTALISEDEYQAKDREITIQLIQTILSSGTNEYLKTLPYNDPVKGGVDGIAELYEYLMEITAPPETPPLEQDEIESLPLTPEQTEELEKAKKPTDPGQTTSKPLEASSPTITTSSEADTIPPESVESLPLTNSGACGLPLEEPTLETSTTTS